MANKTWRFKLEDKSHLVMLKHNYSSGRKEIFLDMRPVYIPESEQSAIDFGGDYSFPIDQGHIGTVHIRTNGITFNYDFSLDTRSLKNNEVVNFDEIKNQRESSRTLVSWLCVIGGVTGVVFGQNWYIRGVLPISFVGIFFYNTRNSGIIRSEYFCGRPVRYRR